MSRIAVVGGGISGLAAAWELAAQAEVVLLEATPAVGGKLRSGAIAGIPVDLGAESMLARRPEGVELTRAAGLDLIQPRTTAALIRAGGWLHPLPSGSALGIPTGTTRPALLSPATWEAVLAEPAGRPLAPLTGDVAVGALVRERLGAEVVERLVDPLLGGVYAGRADALSLRATAPALAERLEHGGSLVRAARDIVGAGDEGPLFVSVPGGLGRLPEALAARGRFEVRTSSTVRSLRRTAAGFLLDGEAFVGVVVAIPAGKAARLLAEVAPGAASELAAIEYASVAVVTLAFRHAGLPPGSGVLVASGEGPAVKGVTITSQKWPLETGGLTVLRASLGRAGDNRVLQRADHELVAVARRDLRALFGLVEEPVDARVTRWGGGLPQYAVGHRERVARIRAAVAAVPGLAVCGAAYDGIGIPACIASARAAAAALLEHWTSWPTASRRGN